MSSFGATPEGEANEAAPSLAYNQATGLITSLHSSNIGSASSQYSPSLDLLTQHGIQLGPGQAPSAQQQTSAAPTGGISFGGLGGSLRPAGPFPAPMSERKADPGEKQLCTFFLRTGTCAYGDRCKFKHPLDRPPPQLNSRGYPVRSDEPDCAHYLKKGWCAFGPTCKFNHPEMQPSILNSYGLSQPTAFVSLPTTTFPSPAVYSVPSAVPTLYYIPPGVGPNQLAGSTVSLLPSNVGAVTTPQPSQLAFQQQTPLTAAAPAAIYRQPAPAAAYGGMGMGGAMGTGVGLGGGMGMGSNVSVLQEAFQGLTLGRTGGLVQRK